jgi:CheY-like chemotaxis protein
LANNLGTILVVDDCDLVLEVLVAILKNAHFAVLEANNGFSALKLAAKYLGDIDLLLAAVEMPEMSGPYLGQELKKARPEIRVMLTCGNILLGDFGCALIQKPFGSIKLIEMVNVTIHSTEKSDFTRRAARSSA